ncbi:hypothetical protein J2X02_003811 [Pseudoxanthomonas japonensis]|uniref:hypothetical protein n=1 Tax=Pseudoxanthomonas japonensis TaxID=69284 RepID=UPI00285D9D9F|nr:hypothetical protein [Pseudoxanthomonas japonensis]MDR7070939.1 hypothetical protein [Pseudoxanthomonas japonensis]
MYKVLASGFTFPAVSGLHCDDGYYYPLLEENDSILALGESPMRVEAGTVTATLLPSFEVSAENGEDLLVGGSGSWEGEGFLALVDRESREARWVLYDEEGEEFVEAIQRSGVVYAVSDGYPSRFEWEVRCGKRPIVKCIRAHVT